MPRIIVVGGGISGLTLAYTVQSKLPGAEVLLLEQQHRLGGTIETKTQDGFTIEAGPNGFPNNNPSTLDLSRNLGLADQVVTASESAGKNRFLFLDERLRKLPSSLLSLLTSPLLSWRSKVRILTERWQKKAPPQQDESIHAFARRRAGGEIADTFVDAFVTGILAGDARLLSVRASFPRLAGWEQDHGSVSAGMAHARKARRDPKGIAQRPAMYSFQGGLSTLVHSLSKHLAIPPLLGVAVKRIVRAGNEWQVEAEGQDRFSASAVVLCSPAYAQAEAIADLDPGLAELLEGIAYNRVAVVALGYRRAEVTHPLDGFGYLSPQRDRRDVLGVQWCSSIYPGRAPQGMILLRAMCGGWHRGDMVDWDDQRLIAAVRGELHLSLGITANPVLSQVIRWPRAIPQYLCGHLDRVAAIEGKLAAHSGLFLGGNAFRGVAINDCVQNATELATRVVAWYTSTTTSGR